MSGIKCTCEKPVFGNTGLVKCVIEMKTIAFAILMPRFNSAGARNTIDLSSPTLGQDILDKINAADPSDRIYPIPRMENMTFERTDTVYEEAPSTRKYKIDGVGGVRTVRGELWAKSAVHALMRELKKFGCDELDFLLVDIAGAIWGIKDDVDDTVLRGYEMSTETFDVFKMYPTDTTVQKLDISWDQDNQECEENSYPITADELGFKATTLSGLVTAFQTLTEPADGVINQLVYSGFGTAGNRNKIVGLDTIVPAITLTLFNVTQDTAMTAPTGFAPVAGSDGEYVMNYLTAEAATNDVIRLSVSGATGYDVQDAEFTHTF